MFRVISQNWKTKTARTYWVAAETCTESRSIFRLGELEAFPHTLQNMLVLLHIQAPSLRQHCGKHPEKFGRAAFPLLELRTQLLFAGCCCAPAGLLVSTLRWERAQAAWATVTVGFEMLWYHHCGVWSLDRTHAPKRAHLHFCKAIKIFIS